MGDCMAIVLARDRDSLKRVQDEFQAMLPKVEPPMSKEFPVVRGSTGSLLDVFARTLLGREADFKKDRRGQLISWLSLAALLFMLLPTVNLVNVNVSRILERASEIGIRKAFGASSWTLVGQFVIENVVLTLIGGAIGFLLSLAVLQGIVLSALIPYADFQVSYRVFGAGLAMALFFGLLSGVYPAWKMSRLHPVEALRGASL
jgi:putative ABC transport system permease protein